MVLGRSVSVTVVFLTILNEFGQYLETSEWVRLGFENVISFGYTEGIRTQTELL